VIQELEIAITCKHSLSAIARVWLFVIFWSERALLLPEDMKELQRVECKHQNTSVGFCIINWEMYLAAIQ